MKIATLTVLLIKTPKKYWVGWMVGWCQARNFLGENHTRSFLEKLERIEGGMEGVRCEGISKY